MEYTKELPREEGWYMLCWYQYMEHWESPRGPYGRMVYVYENDEGRLVIDNGRDNEYVDEFELVGIYWFAKITGLPPFPPMPNISEFD